MRFGKGVGEIETGEAAGKDVGDGGRERDSARMAGGFVLGGRAGGSQRVCRGVDGGPEGQVWSRRTGPVVQKDRSSPEGRVQKDVGIHACCWGGMAKMPLEVAVAPGLWLIRFVCE